MVEETRMFNRLIAYIDSVVARDPAPRSRWEVLLYPGFWAVSLHRVAHPLFRARLFFLARVVNHFARFLTAIDIHPGATIGRHLFIDHGFTVIGETAEIGDTVTIYQCVTLGGTNPANGVGGKRHPTLLDGAIIGSGAQILGPITVGRKARVGANAVVTEDVPDGVTMVGVKAHSTQVAAQAGNGRGAGDFLPYGTPCKDPCADEVELATQRFEALEAEVASLRDAVALLVSARDATGAQPDGAAAPLAAAQSAQSRG